MGAICAKTLAIGTRSWCNSHYRCGAYRILGWLVQGFTGLVPVFHLKRDQDPQDYHQDFALRQTQLNFGGYV
jgi:hypothetical protein